MIKKYIPFYISVLLIVLLIGCNDSPTDLGKGYVDPLDGVGITSFDSSVDSVNQYSKTILNVYSLGTSARLLLGKSDNVKAFTLLKFAFSLNDSIKTQIINNELIVLDSWIELTKEYRFGDSSATFEYTAHKITSDWTSSGFTADSLDLLQRESNDVSSLRTTDNDTLYTFHLDTTVTSFWMHDYADTNFVGYNYGLLLSPDTINTTNKVLGFTALNSTGEDEPILKVVVQKPGSYTDTLFGYILSDISVVKGETANVNTENIAIQSSLTSEGFLFFDLSVLPKNITINSASLTLTVDTLETKVGTSYTNKLLAYLVADSTKDSVNSSYYEELTRNEATFSGSILNIVRAWNNNVSNQGIIIKAKSEQYGVELFAVKGSNASILSQRPKLKLVYSRK